MNSSETRTGGLTRTLRIHSPAGWLELRATDEALTEIRFGQKGSSASRPSGDSREGGGSHRILREAARQLEDYFAGRRKDFTLPLAPEGTPFQQEVWAELRSIPYGTTISYKELAQRIHRPAAVRAVGLANGRNPLPIVIPCHRVIGHDGSLTGYGGGLEKKRILLELEGASPAPTARRRNTPDRARGAVPA